MHVLPLGAEQRARCVVKLVARTEAGAIRARVLHVERLPEVLAAHGESIRVLHTLTPIGVAMAGEDEVDPYKD